jgi:hypothetical protein
MVPLCLAPWTDPLTFPETVPGRPHYVVLCNFDEFWIYDFDVQLDEPLDKLRLTELPIRAPCSS